MLCVYCVAVDCRSYGNLLLLLGICLLTGLYEESFMRVLGIEAFERAFGYEARHLGVGGVVRAAARGRARRIGRPAGAFAGGVEVWAGSAVRRDPGCAVCANASVMALRIHPCRLRCFVSGAKRAPNRHDARNICIGGRGATPWLLAGVGLMLSGIVLKIRKEIA